MFITSRHIIINFVIHFNYERIEFNMKGSKPIMRSKPGKWLVIIALLAQFLVPLSAARGAASGDEDNLLQNPGFEEATLAPWTTSPANHPEVLLERDTLIYRSGEASLKFTPRYGAASNVRQQIVMKRGLEYTFSAWVRLNHDTGKNDFVQMKLDYANSTDAGYKPGGTSYPQIARISKVETDWVELQGTHIYDGELEEVAVPLYFETTQYNYAVINIDDVRMTEEKYAAAIEVDGPLSFSVPQDEPVEHQLAATIKNQHGSTDGVEDEQVAWAFEGSVKPGLSLSAQGVLTIEPLAEPGYADISAWPVSRPQVKQTVRAVVYSALPSAQDVHIVERPAGKALTGVFTLVSATVGESVYRWLEAGSLDGPFVEISGENTASLTVTEDLEDRFVRFEVTPVDGNGIAGHPAASQPVQVRFARSEYYVDPEHGDDANKGTRELPFQTIERARDTVRQFNGDMQEDITIYLRGGEYNYASPERHTSREVPIYSWAWGAGRPDGEPLGAYMVKTGSWVLDWRDSGSNGYSIVYKAYPGETPVVSGGRTVQGWTLYDADRNIYRAFVGLDGDFRQLYVDGKRAVVARSDGPPAGLTFDKERGHTTTDAFMADWGNQQDMELVYHSDWVSHRIKVESITREDDLAVIRLDSGRWNFAVDTGIPSITSIDKLKWVENAYELLDSEGEWYLDRQSGYVYYKPRSTEDMAAARVVVPVVDELLTVKGASPSEPVEHVAIEGISFEYAGWLRPNAARGHHANQNNTLREEGGRLPEGAVTFQAARHISFAGNSLSKLGSTGLLMKGGIQSTHIAGNQFYDISGSGMNIEDPTVASPSAIRLEPELMLDGIEISNNYIHHIGLEYESATGLSTSIGQNISISHNEIAHIPYTAIHMGWHSDGLSRNIRVENNYIHDLLTTSIYDGGAIYSLGKNLGSSASPAYTVTGNYIRNQLNKSGVLFPDNESTWWYAADNVVDLQDSPGWGTDGAPPKLIHIHATASSNHLFENNYATTGYYTNNGSNNVIRDTHVYPDASWPAEALDIIREAGLEPEYAHIRSPEEDNLLFNGGFETRQPQVWEGVQASWRASSAQHVAGVKGALVTPAEPEGHIRQSVALTPGVTYAISAWVRLEPGTGAGGAALLRLEPEEEGLGEGLTLDARTVGTGEWTPLSALYTPTGAGLWRGSVHVQLDGAAGAVPYWLDEWRVTAVPSVSVQALQAAVAGAWADYALAVEGAMEGMYRTGSKAVFRQGITDAEAALEGEGQERYHALLQLYTAWQWFGRQVIVLDKTRLEEMLRLAGQLHQDSAEVFLELGAFPPGSKEELWAAMEQARQALLDAAAGQEAIDEAAGDLELAVERFRNRQYKLDDSLIRQLAEHAEELLTQAAAGSAPGQYPAEEIARLQAVAGNVYAWQSASPTLLMNSIFQDENEWSQGEGKSVVRQMDGSLQFFGKNMTYSDYIFQDQVFEFDLQVEYKSSGDWPGFTIRSRHPDSGLGKTPGKEETAYLVSFKREVWELQKWRDGVREEMLIGTFSTMTPRWGTLSNTHIEGGQQYRVRFGAVNVENGVRLFMYVNDQLVFDNVDDRRPLMEGGYFSVYASAAPLVISPPAILTEEQLKEAYEALSEGISAFKASVVPEPGSPGPVYFIGNEPAVRSASVYINGSGYEAGTLKITREQGQTQSLIELDGQKLEAVLEEVGPNQIIRLELEDESPVVIAQLSAATAEKMRQRNMELELRTANAFYKLPFRLLDMEDLAAKLETPADSGDVQVQIRIAETGADKRRLAEAAAGEEGFAIVAPFMDFSVGASYGDSRAEAADYAGFVERGIAIPEGAELTAIATGLAVEEDGTVSHAPTRIVGDSGRDYARISSLGNGTYAVVSRSVVFADAANHWGQSSIHELASRMILAGTENGRFEPEREITRAEFAAIIGRGLGLGLGEKPLSEQHPFYDIPSRAWYEGAVHAAYGYQLIGGYEDGTFRPAESITRQEAMNIVAKAMGMTGLKDKLPGSSRVLDPYTDKEDIAGWAYDGVLACVESGIVSGRSESRLDPQGNITRAEAAAIVYRLLGQSNLI